MTKEKSTIIFRADGNAKIGLGHLVRSCALADMLNVEFTCRLYVQNPSPSVIRMTEPYFASIRSLTETDDFLQEAEVWATELDGSEIIVLDGYNFNLAYQHILAARRVQLVCIDDIPTHPFAATAIINHNGSISKSAYKAPPDACFYLGTSYALLRNAFLQADQQTRAQEILICMGGADTQNHALNVLQSLVDRKITHHCHVVLGNANPHLEKIRSITAMSETPATFHVGLNEQEMAALMARCAYAICPPSTVSYEYLTIHGELYLLQTADNQELLKEFLLSKGIAFPFEELFVTDQQRLMTSQTLQHQYFDRKSPNRLLRAFKRLADEKTFSLEVATVQDSDILYEWANNDEVRANSFSSERIAYDAHIRWLTNKLTSSHCYLFLLKKNGVPCGQIRLDLMTDGDTAEIGYSVATELRGQGLGITLVRLAIKKILEDALPIKRLRAVVKTSNHSSAKVFSVLNFNEEGEEDIHNERCFVYTLNLEQ